MFESVMKQLPGKVLVALVGAFSFLVLNELVMVIVSAMTGLSYEVFPDSIFLEYQLIVHGLVWVPLVGLAFILSTALGLIATCFRQKLLGGVLLGLPLSFFIGSMLGNLLFAGINNESFYLSPFALFKFYLHTLPTSNRHWLAPVYGVTLFLAVFFYFGCLIKFCRGSSKVHGSARYANYFDLLKYKMFKREAESLFLGTWLGKSLYSNGYEHVLMLAPTGQGKSSAFGIINIIDWGGSSVSNDTSLELYRKTSRYCREVKGHQVYLFAPRQNQTHCWNPFDAICRLDSAQRWGEIARICALIVPEAHYGDSSWVNAARNGIECVAAYLVSTTGYCTLGDIAQICCRGDFDEWLESQLDNPLADAHFNVRANAYLSVRAHETRSGVKFNMDAFLGLYLDPVVRAATSKSDFNLADLRKVKMDIFIGIPQGQMQTLSPLITMFWEDLAHQMSAHEPGEDEPHIVFCNIDETGNMGRIDTLRTGSTFFRKYKLRIAYYFQYTGQPGDTYSDKEMKAFLNTKTKVFFTPSDDDDIEYISKLSGKKTVRYKTKSHRPGGGAMTINEHYEQKNVLEYNDIKYLPEDKMYIQIDAKYTIKAKKKYYFNDKNYKGLEAFEVSLAEDTHLPKQTPIFPTRQGSVGLAREMLDDKKEKEVERQKKHDREIDKIRAITKVVLESVDRKVDILPTSKDDEDVKKSDL